MSRRHLAAAMAGVALATVLMGATGVTVSASTLRPAAASNLAGGTWHGCPYGYICIHIYHTDTEKFSWINLKSCSGHFFDEGVNYANDHIFGRDCKADGYGIVVRAYAIQLSGESEYLGEVWDHSSSGNGAWRMIQYPASLPGEQVYLDVIQTKNGQDGKLLKRLWRDYQT